ncbi:MAG: hypothetical protein RRA15_08460 [bacterium]|nr:hypothetical protein [bacterium]MDT8366512.1 hypothetical protein [bacterium]
MSDMSDKEKKLREQLEEEALVWVKEESARRYQTARETLERQGRESEEHMRHLGVKETGTIASETQLSISYAKSELYKEVRFEADQWIEDEVIKRMKGGD